ncbi:hypothetical protein [Rhodoplanes sp. Z2-YC6860]|nr:hypothetical protein [Rhodoplanes sp. Z2-YC6860]
MAQMSMRHAITGEGTQAGPSSSRFPQIRREKFRRQTIGNET